MGYLKKIEYEIVLQDSLSIIRGCSGCGKKAHFQNTKKFRVNANGNKLDVWLIYQCEECRHTLNLAIYERQKVLGEQILFTIQNPCELKIPPEKQIAAVLGWSRSQVKKLMEQGEIKVETSSRQSVSFCVNDGAVLRMSGPV